MVGVPGRSKACSTCKKRHVACDLRHLTREKCGPCEKSKRVCSFPRGHIFVNHDEGTHKTVYRKTDGERDHSDQSVAQTPNSILKIDNPGQNGHINGELRLVGYCSNKIPKSVESTALITRQILASARAAISTGQQEYGEFPQYWSAAITSQSLDSWACRTSPALACYTAWMGRQNEDPYLMDASRKLYVQGLKECQQSINDPGIALSDETLSACIGLIIYEALECPDRSYSAYHKHIDGCSALIKLRGIDAHRDGVGHDLFRGFRYIAVLKALQDHRGTYLIERSWSEIPFSVHPKDMHDRLLDILAEGACSLGESDRLATTSPSEILIALLKVDDRITDLNDQMEKLYAEIEREHDGPIFWSTEPSLSVLDDDCDKKTDSDDDLATPLSFSDQDTARLLTLYWAQQTLLRMGRAEIRNAFAQLAAAGMVQGHAERVNRSLSRPLKPMEKTARLVLRSREYCSRSQSTLLRYSVPLNITLDTLANKPELYAKEIKFAKEIKRHISQRHLRITQYTSTLQHVKDV